MRALPVPIGARNAIRDGAAGYAVGPLLQKPWRAGEFYKCVEELIGSDMLAYPVVTLDSVPTGI